MAQRVLESGVWGVVATPFRGDDHVVDHDSLAKIVTHYAGIGATGLTVLGVFGEAAALGRQERRDVLRTVVSAVSLPLVVGVTALATRPAIDEVTDIQDAVGDRLAGAMLQLNSPRPAVLARHLTAVNAATGSGIVAQNYPVASGVSIDLTAEIEALGAVSGLVAVKAEAAPTALRIAALTARLDVPVFGGLGGIALIDELALGAAGAMTGFSYPEALVATCHAHTAGGFDAARAALAPYLPLINFEQQPGIALGIRKSCLVARGLIADAAVRAPSRPMPAELAGQLARHLAAIEALRGAG
jgi:4-hydroxy-tetrahydrodipicolinate synthase